MISLPLSCHRAAGLSRASVSVDEDGDGYITLTIDAEPKETFDDRDIHRSLLPSEARELAAMLWHYSLEVER